MERSPECLWGVRGEPGLCRCYLPGWIKPANLTPGMCRDVQYMPSKSHIALALYDISRVLHKLWQKAHGFGYMSSKKPPPFSLAKMPVNPHGASSWHCTSMISTSRTSPGSAPSISNGPVRKWTRVRSTSRMSLAESLFLIWPPVQSTHSILTVSPSLIVP